MSALSKQSRIALSMTAGLNEKAAIIVSLDEEDSLELVFVEKLESPLSGGEFESSLLSACSESWIVVSMI